MMVDIAQLVHGMTVALQTISGLRVYETRPGTIDPPSAIFTLEKIDYDTSMARGSDDVTFMITVFTSSITGDNERQLWQYAGTTGPSSIKNAVEADQTLGGVSQFVMVTRVLAPGIAKFGGADYFAEPFEVVIGV